jgi:hypothetical protein
MQGMDFHGLSLQLAWVFRNRRHVGVIIACLSVAVEVVPYARVDIPFRLERVGCRGRWTSFTLAGGIRKEMNRESQI